jgi:hypothetical protein
MFSSHSELTGNLANLKGWPHVEVQNVRAAKQEESILARPCFKSASSQVLS